MMRNGHTIPSQHLRKDGLRQGEAQSSELRQTVHQLSTRFERLPAEVSRRDQTKREFQSRSEKAAQREIEQLRKLIEQQSARLAGVEACLERVFQGSDEVRSLLTELGERLEQHDDEIHESVFEIQTDVARVLEPENEDARRACNYRQLVRRVRLRVRAVLPRNARVLVVSRGDDNLLRLGGRPAGHFPQTEEGLYAGHYPATDLAAIAHLEALRARGADYLLFPSTARWWLDTYPRLATHLRQRYRMILDEDESCLMYSLREAPRAAERDAIAEFEALLADFQEQFDRELVVLDWDSGLDLATRFPEHTVFSAPTVDPALPYIDHSIDIVAVPLTQGGRLDEARRVAAAAVAVVRTEERMPGGPSKRGGGTRLVMDVEWQAADAGVDLPTTSIIIPCFNKVSYTRGCLDALRENLPARFRGEIVVVDDASTDETAEYLRAEAARDERVKIVTNRRNVGFILSCNRGARKASGDVLVFLNNDTIPLPGWLPPLLRTLRDFPDAGAVGGKLIYPDGRLQEAGSVVFKDASGANFGRNDYEIDAALYNYVRPVDYCSGALLATPRRLFQKLGGFDTCYRPAYYEDADYCFRLRRQSYRVYYQPESAIVHLEGVSSGTDCSNGVKRYQLVNREKFLARWARVLRRHRSPPSRYDRSVWATLAIGGASSKGVER